MIFEDKCLKIGVIKKCQICSPKLISLNENQKSVVDYFHRNLSLKVQFCGYGIISIYSAEYNNFLGYVGYIENEIQQNLRLAKNDAHLISMVLIWGIVLVKLVKEFDLRSRYVKFLKLGRKEFNTFEVSWDLLSIIFLSLWCWNSEKKKTRIRFLCLQFGLRYHSSKVKLFRSFFGRIE